MRNPYTFFPYKQILSTEKMTSDMKVFTQQSCVIEFLYELTLVGRLRKPNTECEHKKIQFSSSYSDISKCVKLPNERKIVKKSDHMKKLYFVSKDLLTVLLWNV